MLAPEAAFENSLKTSAFLTEEHQQNILTLNALSASDSLRGVDIKILLLKGIKMAKLIKEDGSGVRLHIESPLMGESLVSKEFLKRTESAEYFRMHPDINVLKIGGQSIMDRGGKALFPILDVLIEAKDKHKILLMTGGGTRARHVYNIGVDLGMPTGVLSKLGDKVSW